MTERLRRLESTFQRYPIYFLTACTHERRQLLANPMIHSRLVDFAEEGEDRGAWLGDYVLTPDHLHLFVAVDDTRITLRMDEVAKERVVANPPKQPHSIASLAERIFRPRIARW